MHGTNMKIKLYVGVIEGGTRGGTASLQPQIPTPPKKKKKLNFVDTAISKVLHNLPFRRNQTLKPADDWCVRILKNKIKNLGYRR